MTLWQLNDLLVVLAIRVCRGKEDAARRLGLASRTISTTARRMGLTPRTKPEPLSITLGQINYDAFCQTGNGLHPLTLERLPPWKDLTEQERWHWEDGATAVAAVNLMKLVGQREK